MFFHAIGALLFTAGWCWAIRNMRLATTLGRSFSSLPDLDNHVFLFGGMAGKSKSKEQMGILITFMEQAMGVPLLDGGVARRAVSS